MAFKSKAEVTAEFRNYFPDCIQGTADSLFVEAVQELARDLDICTDSASLRLTAGTAGYNFVSSAGSPWYALGSSSTKATSGIAHIYDVFYVRSASDRTRLEGTSRESLSRLDSNFRYADSAEPRLYYMGASPAGASSINFWNPPDTATSGSDGSGFPRIDIYYRLVPASPSEVPDTVRNYEVVRDYMLKEYALRVGDPREQQFAVRFTRSKARAAKTLYNLQRDNPQGFVTSRSWPVY